MTIQIAQISDLHLFVDPEGELKGWKPQQGVSRVLETIRQDFPGIHQLISTGDHTHDELPGTYSRLRSMWTDWQDRLHLVPGNHDDRAVLRDVFPELPSLVAGRIGFQFQAGGWLIVGLDSHVPGQLYGEVGEAQWSWVDHLLQQNPASPTALFLHHPPISIGSPWMDQIGLRDRDRLVGLLSRHRQIRFISHGHIHQEHIGDCAGTPVLSCPSSAIQFRPRTAELEVDALPPGFRIFDLAPDGSWESSLIRVRTTTT